MILKLHINQSSSCKNIKNKGMVSPVTIANNYMHLLKLALFSCFLVFFSISSTLVIMLMSSALELYSYY